MGFFRDVGRRAEKLKQQVSDAAADHAAAECTDCGKSIYTDRTTCPECGSEALEPTASEESTTDADEADTDGTDAADRPQLDELPDRD